MPSFILLWIMKNVYMEKVLRVLKKHGICVKRICDPPIWKEKWLCYKVWLSAPGWLGDSWQETWPILATEWCYWVQQLSDALSGRLGPGAPWNQLLHQEGRKGWSLSVSLILTLCSDESTALSRREKKLVLSVSLILTLCSVESTAPSRRKKRLVSICFTDLDLVGNQLPWRREKRLVFICFTDLDLVLGGINCSIKMGGKVGLNCHQEGRKGWS